MFDFFQHHGRYQEEKKHTQTKAIAFIFYSQNYKLFIKIQLNKKQLHLTIYFQNLGYREVAIHAL